MILRKLFSQWPFDPDSRSFVLDDPDMKPAENHVLVEIPQIVLPIVHPAGCSLIVSRFSYDGSVIRELTPEERGVAEDQNAPDESRSEMDSCLCLLRIDVPTHTHWNPFSEVLNENLKERKDVSYDSTTKFIRVGQLDHPVGIVLRLKKYGTVFVYETLSNTNHCITYDGELIFFSGEKVKVHVAGS
jgi:hypothetical protein